MKWIICELTHSDNYTVPAPEEKHTHTHKLGLFKTDLTFVRPLGDLVCKSAEKVQMYNMSLTTLKILSLNFGLFGWLN